MLWSQLKHFYRQQLAYAKPALSELIAFSLLHQADMQPRIVAAVRLRPYEGNLLLTGLVTHKDFRNQGIAGELLTLVQEKLAAQPSFLFCSPELNDFYQRYGFERVDVEQLNAESTDTKEGAEQATPSVIQQKFFTYKKGQANLTLMSFKGCG
ncbi:N-acetyltransferase [Shewanella maritima]|uniref:N-acetyltransferase n=1 Tax=Shewanella maritima TaxID=2520507 RepID=A0A411PJT7_9GAMM|nr:GNAT family N-acetyltransferase [Shewanella maritima]QBF83650.1 N-acetyltransferase [Shewanella maritima]